MILNKAMMMIVIIPMLNLIEHRRNAPGADQAPFQYWTDPHSGGTLSPDDDDDDDNHDDDDDDDHGWDDDDTSDLPLSLAENLPCQE